MSDSRMRVWFALFVLAVFAIGLASGIFIGRRMIGPGIWGPPPFGGPGVPMGMGGRGRGPGARPDMLLQRLTDELDLTAEQQAQVRAVLDARRGRLEQMQADARQRFEQEQASLREDIRRVLRPDQQQKFERWIAAGPPGRGRGPRRDQ